MLGWLDIIDMNTLYFIQLSFYYFVFEMRGVIKSLDAKTTEENVYIQKRNNKFKIIFITVSVVVSLGYNALYYRSVIQNKYEDDSDSAVSILTWIIKSI